MRSSKEAQDATIKAIVASGQPPRPFADESNRFDSIRGGMATGLGLNIHRFLPDGFVDDMDKSILAFCGTVPI